MCCYILSNLKTKEFNTKPQHRYQWGHVAATRKRSHQWCLTLTQTILKQLKEWHPLFPATNQERPYEQLIHYSINGSAVVWSLPFDLRLVCLILVFYNLFQLSIGKETLSKLMKLHHLSLQRSKKISLLSWKYQTFCFLLLKLKSPSARHTPWFVVWSPPQLTPSHPKAVHSVILAIQAWQLQSLRTLLLLMQSSLWNWK